MGSGAWSALIWPSGIIGYTKLGALYFLSTLFLGLTALLCIMLYFTVVSHILTDLGFEPDFLSTLRNQLQAEFDQG